MEARVNFSRNQLITSENIQFIFKFSATQRDFFEESRTDPSQTSRNSITDSNLVGLAAFALLLIKSCSLAAVAPLRSQLVGRENRRGEQRKNIGKLRGQMIFARCQ